jgi:hypothetical protein
MTFSPEQQKKMLIALLAGLALLIIYRVATNEKPRTAPLTYARGAVATSPVRGGIQAPGGATDSLQLFLAERSRKFPGVARDLFRMENPAKPKPKSVVASVSTPTVPPPPPPPTPEEIAAAAARAAADAARADMAKIHFLGYLTDRDSSLFLSKDGQVFIVRVGDVVTKTYRVKSVDKEYGKDFVILQDTATNAEVRVELSGGAK